MLKARQQLRLLQKISPQQIQFIKLLQVPTVNLEARIKEEMETNPALEDGSNPETDDNMTDEMRAEEQKKDDAEYFEGENQGDGGGEEFSLDDYLEGDSYNYKTQLPSQGDDEEEYETPIVQLKSLYDLLLEQLGMTDFDARQMTIAEHLIGSIEEDGYLRRPVPAIVNDLTFRYNLQTSAEEVEDVLKKLQRFDPPGIGARDLKECLLLQLARKESSPDVKLAQRIVSEFFDEFTKKHFHKLVSSLGIDEEHLKEVYAIITHLNPKPGESQSDVRHAYIIPDFSLMVEEGKINVKLNGRNAPDLKVSKSYLRLYEQYKKEQKGKPDTKTRETLDFVKNKIENAQWFIDALKQRQYTLLNTMIAIAEKQTDFFTGGGDEKKLKPMILKDIADEIGMDISTVSRVANSKYVQTESGIYPLKFFFSEGITTDSGEEVSNKEVKKILEELIGAEDKRKPLSDDKLSDILRERGYNIARRTVAKYREQMDIPVARLRKEM